MRPVKSFIASEKGGVKGAAWTIGLVVVIVIVVLMLFIVAPDLVFTIFYRLVDFVLGNYGI